MFCIGFVRSYPIIHATQYNVHKMQTSSTEERKKHHQKNNLQIYVEFTNTNAMRINVHQIFKHIRYMLKIDTP